MRNKRFLIFTIAYVIILFVLTACGSSSGDSQTAPAPAQSETAIPEADTSVKADEAATAPVGTRDNTPVCLVPEASGTNETRNEVAVIDTSHTDLGYVMAAYTGSVAKIKLRIVAPDTTVYTYDLHPGDYEVFPLSSGNGTYEITIYENVSDSNYSTCLYTSVDAQISDEFSPFLYPNQYVSFHSESKTVAKGAELAASANTDIDVIVNVYNYITSTISYDYEKASQPPTGYLTDIDAILDSGTGICLDYAAVMAAMLRSQSIPTRLEVGYANDVYHAWLSAYTEETGWLNGIIEFDGNSWTLVDPTFGANSSEKELKKFIGDGSNYTLQKLY